MKHCKSWQIELPQTYKDIHRLLTLYIEQRERIAGLEAHIKDLNHDMEASEKHCQEFHQ